MLLTDALPTGLATTLAMAPAFMSVTVRRIAGERARRHCAAHGIRAGDVVHCYGGTPTHLLVESADGAAVVLTRDAARDVEVTVHPRRPPLLA